MDGQWSGLTGRGEWPLVSAGTPTVCSGQGWLSSFCDEAATCEKELKPPKPRFCPARAQDRRSSFGRSHSPTQGVHTRTFPGAAPKKPQKEPGDESLPGSQSMKTHSRNCPAIFTYPVPGGSNQHPVRWGREEERGKTKTPHLVLCWQETTL